MPETPIADLLALQKTARLARLELSAEEIRVFEPQLAEVLKYMSLLQTVDVTGVAPMTHPLELETPLRDDVVKSSPVNAEGQPRVLDCAPEVLQSGFKVPPVL